MFNTLCRFVTKTTTEGLSLFPFVIFHRLVYLWKKKHAVAFSFYAKRFMENAKEKEAGNELLSTSLFRLIEHWPFMEEAMPSSAIF